VAGCVGVCVCVHITDISGQKTSAAKLHINLIIKRDQRSTQCSVHAVCSLCFDKEARSAVFMLFVLCALINQ
jgi:hypothetical protein